MDVGNAVFAGAITCPCATGTPELIRGSLIIRGRGHRNWKSLLADAIIGKGVACVPARQNLRIHCANVLSHGYQDIVFSHAPRAPGPEQGLP